MDADTGMSLLDAEEGNCLRTCWPCQHYKAMIWLISHCGILLTKPFDNFSFGYFVSDWGHTLKKSP